MKNKYPIQDFFESIGFAVLRGVMRTDQEFKHFGYHFSGVEHEEYQGMFTKEYCEKGKRESIFSYGSLRPSAPLNERD
jgi:hypothetical protein